MIYVIKTRNCVPEFIKVGFAKKSLSSRIKTLKTGCPFELDLIFAKNGTLKDEKAIHEKLKSFRGNGEWFQWNKEVQDILGLSSDPKPINPDSPKSFLTPRQKQINHLFRKGHSYSLYVHALKIFLSRHQYTIKDLVEFPKGKEKFVIFEMSHKEARDTFGALVSYDHINDDEVVAWISGLTTPDWKKIYQGKQ